MLIDKFPELSNISYATIQRVLNNDLNYSFKKCSQRFLPFSTKDH